MPRRKRFHRRIYWQILRRQKARCSACDGSLRSGYQFDHVLPIWLGGADAPENLEALCVPCHRHKTALEAGQRAKVTRIKAKREPALTPKRKRPKARLGSRWLKRKVDGSVVRRDRDDRNATR